MNNFKNGLVVLLVLGSTALFAAERDPFGRLGMPQEGGAAVPGGSAAGVLEERLMIPVQDLKDPVPEGYTRVILSDGTMQDYPNSLFDNLPALKLFQEFSEKLNEASIIELNIHFSEEGEDLEGRFELAVKLSNAITVETLEPILLELEERSFNDVLKVAKMLDFLNFNDNENLGLENKIAEILYRKFQELTVAERAALDVHEIKYCYGMNGKAGIPEVLFGDVIRDALSVSLSPDGSLMAVIYLGFDLQLYRLADQRPVGNIIPNVVSVSFSSNELIAVINLHNNLQLYSVDNQERVGNVIPNVSDVSLSQDGSLMAVKDIDNNLQLYTVADQQLVGNVMPGVVEVSFNRDGLMAVRDVNLDLQLYRVANQQRVGNPFPNIFNFSFSPDGSLIAVRYRSNVQLYTVADQQPVGNVISNVSNFSFSPDGLIVINNRDQNLAFYRVSDHQQVGNVIPNVLSFSFNQDGLFMIVQDINRNFRLFKKGILLAILTRKVNEAKTLEEERLEREALERERRTSLVGKIKKVFGF